MEIAYRACSKLLYGKEDLCSLLRDLTSIEIFTNQELYAFSHYVKEKSDIFQTENSAFSATASDNALGYGYDRNNPSTRTTVVMHEALQNAVNGTFLSLVYVCSCISNWNEHCQGLPRDKWKADLIFKVFKWCDTPKSSTYII